MIESIIISLDAIIKSKTIDGRRIIEVEASNQKVDGEGDIILQQALLDSVPEFLKNGILDLDHLSELGARLGIPDPSSYIIGTPLEVKDLGDGRTGVVGEIRQSLDGSVDPKKNKYDEFWMSLQSTPPVQWRASVYGYPKSGMVDDCSQVSCDHGASRYLIKGMQWKSLALTRNPVNEAITGFAKIITAKARIEEIRKDMGIGGGMAFGPHDPYGPSGHEIIHQPRCMADVIGQYHHHIKKDCPFAGAGVKSRLCYSDHFKNCCGMDDHMSEVWANALQMALIDDAKRARP